MLCRARGLLPARVSHGRPVAGKRFIVRSTKTRVDVFGRPYGNQDGEKSESSQNSTKERPLFRRLRLDGSPTEKSSESQNATAESPLFKVHFEGSPAEKSSDTQTRSASKKQTEETESKRSWNGHLRTHSGSAESLCNQEAKGRQKEKTPPSDARATKTIPLSGRVAFGVVTTSRPTDTSVDELVQAVDPIPDAKFPGHHENPTLLVILLTPGLARYALDSNLSDALYQRFKIRIKPGLRIETTSAIVDRLPAERDEPEGSEGMAYMLFRNPPKANPGDRTAFQQSAQKPGSLTFRLPRWTNRKLLPAVDYELQLPLSQTVFTTGLVSTLIYRNFAVDKHPNSSALTLLDEQHLESQTLQLPAMRQGEGTQKLTMPLIPLTPFRTIDYVMGNIIRKLSSQPAGVQEAPENEKIDQTEGTEVADTSMPASQELERSVSKYFEVLDLQPETVSVWAFVVPPEPKSGLVARGMRTTSCKSLVSADEKSIASAWHSETEAGMMMVNTVSNAIRRLVPLGARLVKVLSGGGGWGKKAGLLSLDPDIQYSTRDLRQDQGWEFDFDGVDDGTEAATEAQKNKALGQIAKEGERIMFLIAPKSEHVPTKRGEELDLTLNPEGKDPQKLIDLTFGAIPSSIDLVPQNITSDTTGATVRHYPGRFGMLSEGGMAVTITKKNARGQSKLDVPYGTFVFRQYDRDYLPLPNAAQWVEFSAAGSVASQASAAQQYQSTEQAEETTEPARIERSSENKKLADLFQSFAEHDETKDAQTPPTDQKEETLDSLLGSQ